MRQFRPCCSFRLRSDLFFLKLSNRGTYGRSSPASSATKTSRLLTEDLPQPRRPSWCDMRLTPRYSVYPTRLKHSAHLRSTMPKASPGPRGQRNSSETMHADCIIPILKCFLLLRFYFRRTYSVVWRVQILRMTKLVRIGPSYAFGVMRLPYEKTLQI